MHISPTMHYNARHSYKTIHIIIKGLMNLLHGSISFLPGRISSLTLSVLISSALTNYVSFHVCNIGTGAGRSTCSGTMKLNRFCSWEVESFQ